MRICNTMVMEKQSSTTSVCDEMDSKPAFAGVAREAVGQQEDVFDATVGGDYLGQQDLIKKFNELVGFTTSVGSVAKFYLEMCGDDLDAAVTMFKESLDETPVPPANSSSQGAPHLKVSVASLETSRARRTKVVDVVESPRITAPPRNRTDHSMCRESAQPAHVLFRNQSMRQLCRSMRLRASAENQLSHRQQYYLRGRSASERQVRDSIGSIPSQSSRSLPGRSHSNDIRLQQMNRSVQQLDQYTVAVTRLTSLGGARPNFSGRRHSWRDVSGVQAQTQNPAA